MYVMVAQSTHISYHTKSFVKTEVGCTVSYILFFRKGYGPNDINDVDCEFCKQTSKGRIDECKNQDIESKRFYLLVDAAKSYTNGNLLFNGSNSSNITQEKGRP